MLFVYIIPTIPRKAEAKTDTDIPELRGSKIFALDWQLYEPFSYATSISAFSSNARPVNCGPSASLSQRSMIAQIFLPLPWWGVSETGHLRFLRICYRAAVVLFEARGT
jgi:hypothetical protein